ncbi:hypothetical protein GN244_ATG15767 [Phytophthora infestans]|uniref:Uncharacterized protein n=1 Tax=Phytophthora infestans TaxID=4787 RepID=A0A833SEP8_PHYIN|nr:hypothetical protein GN244_ATG15767 [Phytophthora infestans]
MKPVSSRTWIAMVLQRKRAWKYRGYIDIHPRNHSTNLPYFAMRTKVEEREPCEYQENGPIFIRRSTTPFLITSDICALLPHRRQRSGVVFSNCVKIANGGNNNTRYFGCNPSTFDGISSIVSELLGDW